MGILPALKSFRVWMKDVIELPGNLAKVASANSYLKVREELAQTQKRLEQAEQQLARDAAIKAGRMFFRDNAVWAKDANGNVEPAPYCSACFELNGKAIHLLTAEGGPKISHFHCPVCSSEGYMVLR